ncbi:MAG: DAK2 domain-containing protein [Thermomicrobiales bacterium]
MIERADRVSAAVWDGQALLVGLTAATDWLTANRDHVNALNVFPVPDGDTGTNMALTMRAALDEALKLPADDRDDAGQVAAKAAHGALMGARGNSGVILSQVFRGFARVIAGREEIDGRDLACALDSAQEMAYSAVMRPVEGTMLTVIRVAAEHAGVVAARWPSLPAVLAAGLSAARETLAATPEMLDILKQAGVVDAGGLGFVLILEGLDYVARGESIPSTAADFDGALGTAMPFLDRIDELHGEEAFGYCTNFMIFGRQIDFPRVRTELAELGQSAVIVGDETVVKVHIHTLNPGKVLDYAIQWGDLGQIKIDNMNAQTDALTAQRHDVARRVEPHIAEPEIGRQAVLAVASGVGLSDALRSMGATGIVAGGQTMNPSVEELLAAVEATTTDEVILLPNNPNIVLAANHVPGLTTKRVRVVPSRSVPQGIAALGVFNADADLDANVAAMTKALPSVRTIEITRADKDACIDDVTVRCGQVIGLVDDRVVAGGDEVAGIALDALTRAGIDSAELVTVFFGDEARADETEQIRSQIEHDHDGVALEVYDGGQPHYFYVIAVE